MVVTRSSANGGGGAIDSKDYGVRMTTNCGVGAADPKAIYIRPFCIDNAIFQGDQTVSDGEMPIRKALVPVSFAGSLKEELERIAPARVLRDNERPRTGWLVTGEFTTVDGSHSYLGLHVRVTDIDRGMVIYEFDMAGGNRGQGLFGTVRASGVGKATPFDLVNAAERIYQVLEPNVHRFGARSSISLL